jgi:hypothetical protein
MADPVSQFLSRHGAAAHLIEGGADGLISRWHAFVALAESGYPFGLDDYRNDLDLRSLIALAGIAERVADEDARFRQLLTATDTEIWSSDAPDAWWTLGYPGNAGPDLLADLRAEKLS